MFPTILALTANLLFLITPICVVAVVGKINKPFFFFFFVGIQSSHSSSRNTRVSCKQLSASEAPRRDSETSWYETPQRDCKPPSVNEASLSCAVESCMDLIGMPVIVPTQHYAQTCSSKYQHWYWYCLSHHKVE